MKVQLGAVLIAAAVLAMSAGRCQAQMAPGAVGMYSGYGSIYGAPGYYGTAYGAASFGFPRTYSVYSSSYGPGFGYGYPPYGYAANRYGSGLWRPGFSAPGYAYGASYHYRTYPAAPGLPAPPIGFYAPSYGPPSFYGW